MSRVLRELPKTYDYREVETRWLQTRIDEDFFFKENSEKPQFIIDTPPPYPTGEFQIGNEYKGVYLK